MNCRAPAKAAQNLIDVQVPQKIQDAIDRANPGDIIFVHSGTYFETLLINKSLSLIGENVDSTIIDGNITGGVTGSVIGITTSNVTIKSFTVRNSGIHPSPDSGIRVDRSSGNVIQNNKIISNYDGVFLYHSNDNRVLGNTIANNSFEGISLYFSDNNLVSGNNATNNSYDGVGFYNSNHNVASENTISKNNYGISLYASDNNTIFHNNLNNTYEVGTDSVNLWSYGSEGNYWSDYNGTDGNQDGIGDSSRPINQYNSDPYPLMGTFSSFDITTSKDTYHIALISNSTISGFWFGTGSETGNQILRFNAAGNNGTIGFTRATVPTAFMNTPYIVIVGGEKITPSSINITSNEYAYLYLTYHNNKTITIISSDMLGLIDNLFVQNSRLLLDIGELNTTYMRLLSDYVSLMTNNSQLQNQFSALNMKYLDLWNSYISLVNNYSQLQEAQNAMNASYKGHLQDYNGNLQNLQNLIYMFAATTAIFVATTIYLSRRTHSGQAKMGMTRDREQ